MTLTITVYGTPAPQGSKKHVGHGVMIEVSKKVKPWRAAVCLAARKEIQLDPRFPMRGPLTVTIVFTLARPKSCPKSRLWPDARPDIDKLERSTLDALTDSGVIRDDGQIVMLHALKKFPQPFRHPCDLFGCLDSPGAVIKITQL